MEGPPQNKKESPIAKIVGVDAKTEESLLEFFAQLSKKGERSSVELEHPKGLDKMIPMINRHMETFLQKYSAVCLGVSAEGIHIVDKTKLSDEQKAALEKGGERKLGQYYAGSQHIAMFMRYEEGSKLKFLQALIHEILHLNSFQSLQRVDAKEEGSTLVSRTLEGGEEEEIELALRRVGFRMRSKKGEAWNFYDIDEAVITELEMRFDWEYFGEISELKDEYNRRQAIIKESEEHSEGSKENKELIRGEIAYDAQKHYKEGRVVVTAGQYAYPEERKALNRVIDELYEKNNAEFSSREDVFALFAHGVLTGRLLPIARLIEKTYGKGSFRELGEKTARNRNEKGQEDDKST